MTVLKVERRLISNFDELNVTRFWENDPNCTSVKIKLTPPMDSYTTILLVQTLSITQTTEGWL